MTRFSQSPPVLSNGLERNMITLQRSTDDGSADDVLDRTACASGASLTTPHVINSPSSPLPRGIYIRSLYPSS